MVLAIQLQFQLQVISSPQLFLNKLNCKDTANHTMIESIIPHCSVIYQLHQFSSYLGSVLGCASYMTCNYKCVHQEIAQTYIAIANFTLWHGKKQKRENDNDNLLSIIILYIVVACMPANCEIIVMKIIVCTILQLYVCMHGHKFHCYSYSQLQFKNNCSCNAARWLVNVCIITYACRCITVNVVSLVYNYKLC